MAQAPNNNRPIAGLYGFNWMDEAGELTTDQVDLQEVINSTFEKDAEKIKKQADDAFRKEWQKRQFRNVQKGWVNTPPIPKSPTITQPQSKDSK